MALFVFGTHFKTAPIEVREKLHFPEKDLDKAYASARQAGLNPVLLATCNRVEIYAYEGEPRFKTLGQRIQAWLVKYHGIPLPSSSYLYRLSAARAHAHLCEIASGLESLVIGENQILGQVRDAYKAAKRYTKLPVELDRAFQMAIACGKKVRAKTNIGKGAMSLGSVAIDMIREVYEKDEPIKIALVGAGEVAEEVLKSLLQYRNSDITVVNRNKKNAFQLIKKFKSNPIELKFVGLDKLQEVVSQSQLIIASASATEVLIKRKLYEAHRKKIRFTFFLDLGVPRNIDAAIADLQDVVLYTIDDLQRIVAENLALRELEVGKAKDVVDEKVAEWNNWLTKQQLFEGIKKQISQFHEKSDAQQQIAQYMEKVKQRWKEEKRKKNQTKKGE